jgi:hypothetical protein
MAEVYSGKMKELLDALAMHDDVEQLRHKRMDYGSYPFTGWFCFKDAVFLELAQWYRVHLTSYSQREGREALIYESKEKTECIRA